MCLNRSTTVRMVRESRTRIPGREDEDLEG